jgi:hypothetical protein
MRKRNLLKDFLKDIINQLPVCYQTMDEVSKSNSIYTEYNTVNEGAIFISDYHKPISKITNKLKRKSSNEK